MKELTAVLRQVRDRLEDPPLSVVAVGLAGVGMLGAGVAAVHRIAAALERIAAALEAAS